MTVTAAQRALAVDQAQRIAFSAQPYVFGAAGPDAYDCSGLVLAAWKPAGVTLPHNTVEQATLLGAVPFSWKAFDAAQPGDLIFYYPDQHHVALLVEKNFLGLHLVAQATQEGTLSEVIRMAKYAMPSFIGYVR